MTIETQDYDIIIIGGGTAGPMAAIKAKEQDKSLRVLLLDKANVKRSGAISMGMDGLNNAIIPGHATPEQYTKEITVANDGIVNQATVHAYATHSFEEKLISRNCIIRNICISICTNNYIRQNYL